MTKGSWVQWCLEPQFLLFSGQVSFSKGHLFKDYLRFPGLGKAEAKARTFCSLLFVFGSQWWALKKLGPFLWRMGSLLKKWSKKSFFLKKAKVFSSSVLKRLNSFFCYRMFHICFFWNDNPNPSGVSFSCTLIWEEKRFRVSKASIDVPSPNGSFEPFTIKPESTRAPKDQGHGIVTCSQHACVKIANFIHALIVVCSTARLAVVWLNCDASSFHLQ